VLRYWETEFDCSSLPKRRRSIGCTRKRDVELLLEIKQFALHRRLHHRGRAQEAKEAKKEEKNQLKLPLTEQKYKSAMVKLKKELETLRRLVS
jgi:hypothetical protein